MHEHEMRLTTADPKSGWCNGCTDKPPYTPDMTYALRAKSVVLTFCPNCARVVRDMFTDLIMAPKAKPLIVKYTPSTLNVASHRQGDEFYLHTLKDLYFDDLASKIEEYTINTVFLCSPAVCIGWRVFVRRAVQFVEQGLGPNHVAEQEQAKYRIMEAK